MVLDSLKNAPLYYSLSPRLKQAFELVAATDWNSVEAGRHDLDGNNIFVNVMDVDLKKPENAPLEVHNNYIDIQILIRGEKEAFGWSERCHLRKPQGEFNVEKDICFYDDVPQTYYTLIPGQFTILMPEDGHAPMVGEGKIRKIIVKVRR